MIVSGSHVVGVTAADFRLPPGTALRIERPDARIAPFFRRYHVLDSIVPSGGDVNVEWSLPDDSAVRFIFAEHPIGLRTPVRHYPEVPRASLWGVASRARQISSRGGVTIGANLTPLGWARYLSVRASDCADRVVSLDTAMSRSLSDDLLDQLGRSDQGADVKSVMDSVLLAHLPPPTRDEDDVRTVMQMLSLPADEALAKIRECLPPGRIRGLTARYFGFPLKHLIMRQRFIQRLLHLLGLEEPIDWSVPPPGYFDISHFHRDSRRFLGMTPRQFVQLNSPYLRAVMRAVRAVETAPPDACPTPRAA